MALKIDPKKIPKDVDLVTTGRAAMIMGCARPTVARAAEELGLLQAAGTPGGRYVYVIDVDDLQEVADSIQSRPGRPSKPQE